MKRWRGGRASFNLQQSGVRAWRVITIALHHSLKIVHDLHLNQNKTQTLTALSVLPLRDPSLPLRPCLVHSATLRTCYPLNWPSPFQPAGLGPSCPRSPSLFTCLAPCHHSGPRLNLQLTTPPPPTPTCRRLFPTPAPHLPPTPTHSIFHRPV